jgi:hypothetical protein
MCRFHFARAAILAHVAGFGECVVPLFGFWVCRPRIGPGPVKRLWEDRLLSGVGGFNFGLVHKGESDYWEKLVLCAVVKTVVPGLVAFRD